MPSSAQESDAQAEPPLTGVRVIDSSQIGAGPYLASILGDMGADVIKVEPPGGEPFRTIDRDFGESGSSYFFGMNRSKRSVVLDLRSEPAHAAFKLLVRSADVLIVSMRPAALRRLRIDYECLRSLHPGLIYCSITAFGETGPRSDAPGMDILAQALSGLMGTTGEPERQPVKVGAAVSDFSTTFMGGFAICSALFAREKDGVGQKISLNLLDTSIALMANYVTAYMRTGAVLRPMGSGHPQLAPYQVFDTRDGHLVVACLNDRFWPGLCRALESPTLLADSSFAMNADRVANRAKLIPLLVKIFRKRNSAEWVERLRAEDVPHSEVHRIEDVVTDPQVRHNEMLVELVHPEVGSYVTTGNPVRMSRTKFKPNRYAPRLGEHTEEVLLSLGLSDEAVRDIVVPTNASAAPN